MAGSKFSAEAAQRRAGAKTTVPLETRFWAKVNKDAPGGCWEWTGAKRKGHGTVYLGQIERGRYVLDYSHRVIFRLMGVAIPEGAEVDHVCRNRACCNPAHLRFVTPGVNALENNLSPFAINARRTTCIRGHQFTGRNERGHRVCDTCIQLRSQKRKEAA